MGERMTSEQCKADILDDLEVCRYRWRKAQREGKYFRAESWLNRLNGLLDRLGELRQ